LKNDKLGGSSSSDELDSSSDVFSERYERGIAYLKDSKMELARAEFESILEENPSHALAHFGLGCVYIFQGLRDEALEEWNRAVEIDPNCGEAHYALSWAYYEVSDHEKGYRHLNRALGSGITHDSFKDLFEQFSGSEVSENPEIQKRLASDIGTEAVKKEERTQEPIEASAETLYQHGLIALREGKIDEGLEHLVSAASVDPNRSEIHFELGRAYSLKGEWSRAIEEWERTVELDPNNEDVKYIIAYAIQRTKQTEQVKPDEENRIHDIKNKFSDKSDLKRSVEEKLKNIIASVSFDGSFSNKYFFGIFLFAFSVRILVLYFLPIDWKPVSYHLWQVGYYTLNLGISKGRMWDLHGVEYLYSILPSLTQSTLMWLFRTDSMLPFRIFNILLSSITAGLVYKIGTEHYNHRVGLYSALFVSTFPGLVIWNLLNLYETMAAFFYILSLYFWKKRGFLAGAILALAVQSRMEYWLIAPAVCLSPLLFKSSGKVEEFIPRFIGWIVTMAPFLLFFMSRTGNVIYPLYWGLFGGFGANVLETVKVAFIDENLILWYIFWSAILLISIGSVIYLTKKKVEKSILYAYFLAAIGFSSSRRLFFAISSIFYPKLFPLLGKYYFPELIMGALVIIPIFLKDKFRRFHVEKVLVVTSIVCLFIVVPKIIPPAYTEVNSNTDLLAKEVLVHYNGGVVISDDVVLNYFLIENGLGARELLGSFYSPLYYGNENFNDMIQWFIDNNISIWVQTGKKSSNQVFSFIIEKDPEFFDHLKTYENIGIYRINYEKYMIVN